LNGLTRLQSRLMHNYLNAQLILKNSFSLTHISLTQTFRFGRSATNRMCITDPRVAILISLRGHLRPE
jgi:hypothetical protein